MKKRVLLGLLAIVAAFAPDAEGCKYTVRDVGFVDLGSEPYRLFVRLPQVNGDSLEGVATALQAALLDTNVHGSLLPVADATSSDDAASDDATLLATVGQYLEAQKGMRGPIGVLVSPDERLRLIELPADDGGAEAAPSLSDSVRSIARSATTSPLREQIASELLLVHSVVLLVEGNDGARNQAALDLANESIGHIARSLKSLPKHIANPPKLVVVSPKQAASEAVFLWSLGISTEEPDVAHLVALFGRLRKMGDVLTVPGATARDLSGFLYFVGQDCECELDRSVMQGMMAPHVWDGRLEADAAMALGFDPGHAVVRVEMSRILARGFSSGRRNLGIGLSGRTLDRRGAFGYEEIEIEVLEDDDAADQEARPEVVDPEQANGNREQAVEGSSRDQTGRSSVDQQQMAGEGAELPNQHAASGSAAVSEGHAEEGALDETVPSAATRLAVTAAIILAVVLLLSGLVIFRGRGGE